MKIVKKEKIIMDRIKLYYDNSEIQISTYLLLYFRISGIYVDEKFLNLNQNSLIEIQEYIVKKNHETINNIDYDAHIFIIDKENKHQLDNVIKFAPVHPEKSFVVTFSNILSETEMNQFKKNNINLIISDNEKTLLEELLKKLREENILDKTEYENLYTIYQSYWKYQLRDLLAISRYSVVKDFDILSQTFLDAILSLPKEDAPSTTWNIKYARLYLAYEYNMLCKSLDKRLICSKEYIVNKLKEMLKVNELRDNCQLVLLLAQTYDDLFSEYNIAYEYYLMPCTKNIAFSYFKKGEYWNIYGKNPTYAIKYYEKSLLLFPANYKTWYNLGISYLNLGKVEDSLSAFQYVNLILKKKYQSHHLNELEIRYLYKSNELSGHIYHKYYSDYSNALSKYFFALDIWKTVNKDTYISNKNFTVSNIDTHEKLKKILNIDTLVTNISHILEQIGDKELVKSFEHNLNLF